MTRLLPSAIAAILLMTASSGAYAACTIGGQQVESELSKVEGIRSGEYGNLRRDVRTLRSAAMILQRYGRDDACQQIVSTMNELLRDPRASMQMRQGSGQTGMNTQDQNAQNQAAVGQDQSNQTGAVQNNTTTGNTASNNAATTTDGTATNETTGSTSPATNTFEDRRASAVPLTERTGLMSSADLIGADIYGSDNSSIGEIDDIVLSSDNRPAYALVSFGGFLGIGEEQVAIPVSALSVSEDNYLFVPMTEEQLQGAPHVKRGSGDWWTDDSWRQQNDTYFQSVQR